MSDKEDSTSEEQSETTESLQRKAKPHYDADRLRELYWGEELSQSEIGHRLGVSQQSVSRAMRELGIETRDGVGTEESEENLWRCEHQDGYAHYKTPNGESIYGHQLAALHIFDASDVFDGETHVHHELNSPVPLDLPCNLDVIPQTEHNHLHGGSGIDPDPEEILSGMGDWESPDGDDEDGWERSVDGVDRLRVHRLRRWNNRFDAVGD